MHTILSSWLSSSPLLISRVMHTKLYSNHMLMQSITISTREWVVYHSHIYHLHNLTIQVHTLHKSILCLLLFSFNDLEQTNQCLLWIYQFRHITLMYDLSKIMRNVYSITNTLSPQTINFKMLDLLKTIK